MWNVGGTVADPGALTASGYTFNGWFTAASGGTAVDFGAGVPADTTYYAQWAALADTGFNPAPTLGLALLLIAAGAALMSGRRRHAE